MTEAWKTIDTAPQDASELWLGAPGRVIMGYRSMKKTWRSSWTNDALTWEPTHWMPFEQPLPPGTEAAGQGALK